MEAIVASADDQKILHIMRMIFPAVDALGHFDVPPPIFHSFLYVPPTVPAEGCGSVPLRQHRASDDERGQRYNPKPHARPVGIPAVVEKRADDTDQQ